MAIHFPSADTYEYVRRAVVAHADAVIARQRVLDEHERTPIEYDPCGELATARRKELANADHAVTVAFLHAVVESRRVC